MSSQQPKAFSSLFKEQPKAQEIMKRSKKEEEPRQVNLRLNDTAKKQLDIMAIDHDTTRQALMIEAVNDFFKKYGKPPIA